MNRLRWLELELPFSIKTLGRRLASLSFTGDVDEGFLVDRIRDSYLEARHIQKVVITQSVSDPLGTERVYERIEFRQTTFTVSNDYPQLELTDSPRGLQTFTSRMSEVCEFSVSIAQIDVDVLQWAEKLAKAFPERFAAIGAQASGLVLDEGITARIILAGIVDVRASLAQMTRGQFEGVDKIQLRFGPVDNTTRVILSADGSARILTETTERLKDALRHSLATIRRRPGRKG